MKTIKSFTLIFVLALLLSSCVVKSLHAFYTQDLLFFEQKFIGNWLDSENAHWSVLPFKEVILKENHKENVSELDKDDLKLYNSYKDGYVVYFEKDSTKSTFLAMPFKINNQLFLDFTPIGDRESEQSHNDLYRMHLINTHSLAKLDMDSKDEASIKWLDEDKLKALLDGDKIKIKHETVGFDETVLLTASSEELVKFIEKYMASEDQDKWKTDMEFDLKESVNSITHINKMTFRNTLIFNLVLWICSFMLFLVVFTEVGPPKTIDFIYTGCFLSTIVVPVLINFYVLIPLLLKKERYFFYVVVFIINILVFTQLNIWFFEHLIDYVFPDYYFISYHSNIALFTIFSVFLVITTLIKLSVDWFYFNSHENRELKIRNQHIQTQLSTLRSQINPHFLFNSLNVIYALAIENKAETKDAIVQLSDILRYVIYDSNTERVTLKDEVTLLKNYIEFQQFRHQQNDNISFKCNIEDENYPIYPMLLLPLVENSFKYGIKGDISNTFIRMNLKQKKDEFIFDIENNYSENLLETNEHSGLGLENIKKNLEIVYPKSHDLEIFKSKDTFKVVLKLTKK